MFFCLPWDALEGGIFTILTLVDYVLGFPEKVDPNFVLVGGQHQPEKCSIKDDVNCFVAKHEEHQGEEHEGLVGVRNIQR
jgi:hypothetical protein